MNPEDRKKEANPKQSQYDILLAFAKWSPCIYMGAIVCYECPRKDCGDGDHCDMYHGRIGKQQAFEAGWKLRV